LKEKLRQTLASEGHEVTDFGPASAESCDYPDYAQPVAREVAAGAPTAVSWSAPPASAWPWRANKIAGVRAAPAVSEDEVRLTREHNDANVLTLGARYVDEEQANNLTRIFLHTDFAGGRHARRVAKIAQLEQAPGRERP